MASKKEQLAQEIAKAVGAGKPVALETVDFSDPNRPKTCLEIDFPILPINQVSVIEGNAGKPIYQMSKWWARRRSSVFRSMLIAAATKAPVDTALAAKLVWENYYSNHQKKGAFKHLTVADIFMGGGTTLVEGSRLGMQMGGNDLNPVAWFVVKQELANVDLDEVKRLLADIEAEVKPQIIPFYYCDGPNGEKGQWTHEPSGRVMGPDFNPLSLKPEERKDYGYRGPEIIYTFWAKHGPCQVTGCGHRTPIMTSPVMAVKTLTVKHWEHACSKCGDEFHIEEDAARMAPDVPLYVAPDEHPFSIIDPKRGAVCPHCGHAAMARLGKGKNKKIELSLLVHPQWLAGSPKSDSSGQEFGGSVHDDVVSTTRWDAERASKIKLIEVRGKLPEQFTCPETGVLIKTGSSGGTVPKRSHFACASCGATQDLLDSARAFGKAAPMAGYANQGYAPQADTKSLPYNGRFFVEFGPAFAQQYDAAVHEWESRKDKDLNKYWPRSAIPIGAEIGPHDVEGHHFTHWWTMFNPRQMLVLSQILKALATVGNYSTEIRDVALGAFQQYLRNQNMFCFWDRVYDKLVPHMSGSNFHPKANLVENCVFGKLGRGNWSSCVEGVIEGLEWAQNPWELVSVEQLSRDQPDIARLASGKSEKVFPRDPVSGANAFRASSTDLHTISNESLDLVVTDPPFGDLVQYSELADFFYVWMRLVLKNVYPDAFSGEYTPKTLEAVANRHREPEDPNAFYQRLLTQCWKEAHRTLKPSGILTFTFHHSEDKPWVAVLESLFDSGFYLEATYPIRSDETKGEGQFGSQKVEYDIIHVCRKRTEEPTPVSWARMRREVLQDVSQLRQLLENHAKSGLPEADIQVIKRGKALEYFSRHYGKVYVDEGRPISVRDALVGINQLIDETSGKVSEPPPVTAEPVTRQFLRIFDGATSQPRDQMQKFLRGSGMAPEEFEQRGWSKEEQRVFHVVSPLDLAQSWVGRHRRNMTSDYDQAMFLIGACYDGSGINAAETLKNENFRPHPALKALLEWHSRRGAKQEVRNAASRASSIYQTWENTHQDQVKQLSFFEDA